MEKKSLYAKLLKIQQHIIALDKDKQGNNYKYVTGDKLLGYVKPKMNELGLLLKQEVLTVTNTRQDYTLSSGKLKSEIHTSLTLRFTWIDTETGEKDENLFAANGQNDWDKGVGSALTYGERYFLLKYFHIATDEDDIDNPEIDKKRQESGVTPPKPQTEFINDEQRDIIDKWLNSPVVPDDYKKKVKDWLSITKNITQKQAQATIDKLSAFQQ